MTEDSHGDDVAFIRALAELLRENDLSELEVKREHGEDASLSVRVSRTMPTAAPVASSVSVPSAHPMPAAPDPGTPARAEASDPASHPGAVTSPMVGTAYLQPEPGAEPFVRIGSQVTEGQTLLIVEAMKTMNHIHAPRTGEVTRILVTDGSPVEYGAPLMIVE